MVGANGERHCLSTQDVFGLQCIGLGRERIHIKVAEGVAELVRKNKEQIRSWLQGQAIEIDHNRDLGSCLGAQHNVGLSDPSVLWRTRLNHHQLVLVLADPRERTQEELRLAITVTGEGSENPEHSRKCL